MIEIAIRATGEPRSGVHEILQLDRLDRGDAWCDVHHLYDPDNGYAYDRSTTVRGGGWLWSVPRENDPWSYIPSRWSAMCEPPPDGWSYLFLFEDGTKGVCRVRDVNRALSELGYEVDRRGDAARD